MYTLYIYIYTSSLDFWLCKDMQTKRFHDFYYSFAAEASFTHHRGPAHDETNPERLGKRTKKTIFWTMRFDDKSIWHDLTQKWRMKPVLELHPPGMLRSLEIHLATLDTLKFSNMLINWKTQMGILLKQVEPSINWNEHFVVWIWPTK